MEHKYVGINVAKDDFVVVNRSLNQKALTFQNNAKGINRFIKQLPSDAWCTMEATGVYSVRHALTLDQKGFKVSVINPLQIKRFAQTKLKRAKNG